MAAHTDGWTTGRPASRAAGERGWHQRARTAPARRTLLPVPHRRPLPAIRCHPHHAPFPRTDVDRTNRINDRTHRRRPARWRGGRGCRGDQTHASRTAQGVGRGERPNVRPDARPHASRSEAVRGPLNGTPRVGASLPALRPHPRPCRRYEQKHGTAKRTRDVQVARVQPTRNGRLTSGRVVNARRKAANGERRVSERRREWRRQRDGMREKGRAFVPVLHNNIFI
ncbi:hypothetical protein BJ912DRAFT_920514 [Pholiota molesta]|nr:hypothetical protein BJ912DRAFT_920514 [Pholiota molesta]